jgi:hypothetical protein
MRPTVTLCRRYARAQIGSKECEDSIKDLRTYSCDIKDLPTYSCQDTIKDLRQVRERTSVGLGEGHRAGQEARILKVLPIVPSPMTLSEFLNF